MVAALPTSHLFELKVVMTHCASPPCFQGFLCVLVVVLERTKEVCLFDSQKRVVPKVMLGRSSVSVKSHLRTSQEESNFESDEQFKYKKRLSKKINNFFFLAEMNSHDSCQIEFVSSQGDVHCKACVPLRISPDHTDLNDAG